MEEELAIVGEQVAQSRHVAGERIDQGDSQTVSCAPAELHQRKTREVGPLPMELGVDRNDGLGFELAHEVAQRSIVVDPNACHRGDEPSTRSRPDIAQAIVPPSTLETSNPRSARKSHAWADRPPDRQMITSESLLPNLSNDSARPDRGQDSAPGTCPATYSSVSRTSIKRDPAVIDSET